MERFYLTEQMKWAILIGVILAVILILARLLPKGSTEFDQARSVCAPRGVAHYGYKYIVGSGMTEPDVTCK